MTTTYIPPDLAKIIEDLKTRVQRMEGSNRLGGSSIGGGAIQFVNGQAVVNAITINGPGGQTVLVTPKLGDLLPTAVTATPSWEDGLIVGQAGSSVVDIAFTPATGVGQDQITGWQIKLGTGDGFFTYTNASVSPTRIRNLKPGANYTVAILPIDQFGNITNAGGTTASFTAVGNTGPPSWVAANAHVVGSAGYTTVTLSWNDDTDDFDVVAGNGTFDVQLATDVNFTQNIVNQRVSGTVMTFTGLTTGVSYYARVRALNSSGIAGVGGVANAWITLGGGTPTPLIPGGIDAHATSIDPALVRNTQSTYLVTAGTSNPNTPAVDYSTGVDGNFALTANGATGTPLARVTDAQAFDALAIQYNAPNTGGQPRVFGPYYKGLQPGQYKAVFFLKSTQANIVSSTPILVIYAQAINGNVLENGQPTIVTAAQLGNTATGTGLGSCDGRYHAVSIPVTVIRDFAVTDNGVEFISQANYGTANWSLSHVSVVPFDALVSNEVTAQYIAAGAVVAGKIAAGAVSTESLQVSAVSPYRNLNWDFEDVTAANATVPSHWTLNYEYPQQVGNGPANMFVQSGTAYSGTNALAIRSQQINGTNYTGGGAASDAFAVNPGEILTVDGWLQQNTSTLTGGIFVRVLFGTSPNFQRSDSNITYTDLPLLNGVGAQILPAFQWKSIADIASSSGGTNLLTAQDSSFESPGLGTWINVGAAATLARTTAQAYIGSGSMAITSTAGSATLVVRTDIYAFPAGQAGRARVRYRGATVGRNVQTSIEFTDSAGNAVATNSLQSVSTTTGWTECTATGIAPATATGARVVAWIYNGVGAGEVHYIDGVELLKDIKTNNQVTVPAGYNYARVSAYLWQPTGVANGVTVTLYVDQLRVSGAILGTMIANGTISTPNIVVGGVDADRITAGSITATQIKAGSIDATRITANTLTAGQIAAGTITADRLRTGQLTADYFTSNLILTVAGQAISANYSGGSTGWTIQQSGYAEFNNVSIRGILYAATFGSNTFDFKAPGGNTIGLRVFVDGNGGSGIQLGQGSVNVGSSLYYNPVNNQWVFQGYINSSSQPVFKFNNGFVEFDNPRSTGGYAVLPFQDGGTQGYFIGSGGIGNGQPCWDSGWGLQLEQRGGLYNVFIQGYLDSDARHVGLRNVARNEQQVYIDNFNNAGSRSLTRTGFITFSDERGKADIASLRMDKADTAKEVISKLRPLRYRMKTDESHAREHFGFSAQHVRSILPEAVHEGVHWGHNDNGIGEVGLGISYDTFIPVLVQHNQEQQTEIDELRLRVRKLEKALAAS